MKPRIFRLSYFVWLIIPISIYGIYQTIGSPHVFWNYQYVGTQRANSFSYTACSYIGPTGEFWSSADGGDCSPIKFRKSTRGSTQ